MRRDIERGVEIGAAELLPALAWTIVPADRRAAAAQPGIVDDDAERAEALDIAQKRLDLGFPGEVAGEEAGLAAPSPHFGLDGAPLVGVATDQRNLRPFGGKTVDDPAPDAGVAAGHHHHLACETRHGSSRPIIIAPGGRLRDHAGLEIGLDALAGAPPRLAKAAAARQLEDHAVARGNSVETLVGQRLPGAAPCRTVPTGPAAMASLGRIAQPVEGRGRDQE